MYDQTERPAGPDFLASVAEQNLTSGLLENATEFRVRAAEWRRDVAELESKETTIQTLRDQLRNSEDRNIAAKLALAGK